MLTDKELILALRGTQSQSKRALLDAAAERILDFAGWRARSAQRVPRLLGEVSC